jgi:starch synthase
MERFADGKVHVLFAGYAFFRKGGRELVRAFTSLNRDDAVLHLVTNFTPDGFMTDTTQRDAAEARAGVQRRPNILVHENMGQKEVIALMRKCHVFCLPTFWDTFGLVCLEAMSCGLPCVVTNVGALEEVIENGGNGFVVRLSVNGFGHLVRTGDKPFDNRAAVVEAREFLVAELAAKLTALLDDPQMRAKMGKRSLELCRAKFDFQERRKRMGEIYRTALGVSPDG